MKATEQEERTQSPNTSTELTDTIRRRAYQIYQQRGMADGLEVEDWLRAEAEFVGAQPTLKAA